MYACETQGVSLLKIDLPFILKGSVTAAETENLYSWFVNKVAELLDYKITNGLYVCLSLYSAINVHSASQQYYT
ncbi:hypothetical protein FKM82_025706 [Ascaphus truei]